jgi:predicted amidohydrolase
MNRIWGGLAQRHSVWIVAGSYFGADQTNGSRLYNRAVIYGPEGDVIHEQDKVFLTPFEKSLLGLSSAEIGDAETFLIDGWSCALTICRDSFFDEWNERFGNADLWIDIKANGEEYGEQTPALFAKALPERIGETGVPYGLTACLNGSFLDLLWEGPSSVIRYEESRSSEPEGEGGNGPGKGSGGWRYVRRAESAEEPEIVVAELSLPVDRTPD